MGRDAHSGNCPLRAGFGYALNKPPYRVAPLTGALVRASSLCSPLLRMTHSCCYLRIVRLFLFPAGGWSCFPGFKLCGETIRTNIEIKAPYNVKKKKQTNVKTPQTNQRHKNAGVPRYRTPSRPRRGTTTTSRNKPKRPKGAQRELKEVQGHAPAAA